MDRRDFFKMFAAGATVIPLIGGTPCDEARAMIIEPPKVELAPAQLSAKMMPDIGEYDVTIYATNKATGQAVTINSATVLTKCTWTAAFAATAMDSPAKRQVFQNLGQMTFEVTGVPWVRVGAVSNMRRKAA